MAQHLGDTALARILHRQQQLARQHKAFQSRPQASDSNWHYDEQRQYQYKQVAQHEHDSAFTGQTQAQGHPQEATRDFRHPVRAQLPPHAHQHQRLPVQHELPGDLRQLGKEQQSQAQHQLALQRYNQQQHHRHQQQQQHQQQQPPLSPSELALWTQGMSGPAASTNLAASNHSLLAPHVPPPASLPSIAAASGVATFDAPAASSLAPAAAGAAYSVNSTNTESQRHDAALQQQRAQLLPLLGGFASVAPVFSASNSKWRAAPASPGSELGSPHSTTSHVVSPVTPRGAATDSYAADERGSSLSTLTFSLGDVSVTPPQTSAADAARQGTEAWYSSALRYPSDPGADTVASQQQQQQTHTRPPPSASRFQYRQSSPPRRTPRRATSASTLSRSLNDASWHRMAVESGGDFFSHFEPHRPASPGALENAPRRPATTEPSLFNLAHGYVATDEDGIMGYESSTFGSTSQHHHDASAASAASRPLYASESDAHLARSFPCSTRTVEDSIPDTALEFMLEDHENLLEFDKVVFESFPGSTADDDAQEDWRLDNGSKGGAFPPLDNDTTSPSTTPATEDTTPSSLESSGLGCYPDSYATSGTLSPATILSSSFDGKHRKETPQQAERRRLRQRLFRRAEREARNKQSAALYEADRRQDALRTELQALHLQHDSLLVRIGTVLRASNVIVPTTPRRASAPAAVGAALLRTMEEVAEPTWLAAEKGIRITATAATTSSTSNASARRQSAARHRAQSAPEGTSSLLTSVLPFAPTLAELSLHKMHKAGLDETLLATAVTVCSMTTAGYDRCDSAGDPLAASARRRSGVSLGTPQLLSIESTLPSSAAAPAIMNASHSIHRQLSQAELQSSRALYNDSNTHAQQSSRVQSIASTAHASHLTEIEQGAFVTTWSHEGVFRSGTPLPLNALVEREPRDSVSSWTSASSSTGSRMSGSGPSRRRVSGGSSRGGGASSRQSLNDVMLEEPLPLHLP